MSTPRPAVLSVGLATALSAASGYLVLLLAARSLAEDQYAGWFVFWSAFGLATGTLNGLLQETARAVRTAHSAESGQPSPAQPARPLVAGVCVGAALCALALGSAPLWAESLFAGSGAALPLAMLFAVSAGSVAAQAAVGGLLSAAYAWTPFAVLTVLDAGFRLAVAAGCAAVGAGPGWFSVAAVAGAGSWLLLLAASPQARALASATADVPMRAFLRRASAAVAASAASAVLVMGFPVLLKLATPGPLPDGAGALLLAVTLTRAPLLVPLNVFQGALVAWFTDRRDRPWRALGTAAGAVLAAGALCALASAALGSWLLSSVFGTTWPFGRAVLAELTLGAALIALLTCTGVACLAVGRGRGNAVGWWAAALASLTILLLPALAAEPIELRVGCALVLGPLAGTAVHLGVLRRL